MKQASSRRPGGSIASLRKGLEAAAAALPNDVERAEARKACDEIISFLSDLRDSIGRLPADDDILAARAAAERLGVVLERAQANPLISSALALRKPIPRREAPVPIGEQIERARAEIADLEGLTEEALHQRLASETRYSARELRAIATALGIGSTKGLDREGLARRIASKIINFRGYKLLGTPSEPRP